LPEHNREYFVSSSTWWFFRLPAYNVLGYRDFERTFHLRLERGQVSEE